MVEAVPWVTRPYFWSLAMKNQWIVIIVVAGSFVYSKVNQAPPDHR